MGNSWFPLDVKTPLDGSADDIYRLVFMPDTPDVLEHINKCVAKYPACLNEYRSCHMYFPDTHTRMYMNGNPLYIAATYSNYSSLEIIRHLITLNPDYDYEHTCNDCFRKENMINQVARNMHSTTKFDTVKLLLDAGVDKKTSLDRNTLLFTMCKMIDDDDDLENFKEYLTKYKPTITLQPIIYGLKCHCYNYFRESHKVLAELDYLRNRAPTPQVLVASKLLEDYCMESYNSGKK